MSAGRWGTTTPGGQQCVWLSVRMHLPADMAIVGRDREQAELATALASTRAGYGRAVLLLGEPGMGKSMLADWLVSQAEQAGMQVARGACSAAGMPPLWPWRRSLAAIVPAAGWLGCRCGKGRGSPSPPGRITARRGCRHGDASMRVPTCRTSSPGRSTKCWDAAAGLGARGGLLGPARQAGGERSRPVPRRHQPAQRSHRPARRPANCGFPGADPYQRGASGACSSYPITCAKIAGWPGIRAGDR